MCVSSQSNVSKTWAKSTDVEQEASCSWSSKNDTHHPCWGQRMTSGQVGSPWTKIRQQAGKLAVGCIWQQDHISSSETCSETNIATLSVHRLCPCSTTDSISTAFSLSTCSSIRIQHEAFADSLIGDLTLVMSGGEAQSSGAHNVKMQCLTSWSFEIHCRRGMLHVGLSLVTLQTTNATVLGGSRGSRGRWVWATCPAVRRLGKTSGIFGEVRDWTRNCNKEPASCVSCGLVCVDSTMSKRLDPVPYGYAWPNWNLYRSYQREHCNNEACPQPDSPGKTALMTWLYTICSGVVTAMRHRLASGAGSHTVTRVVDHSATGAWTSRTCAAVPFSIMCGCGETTLISRGRSDWIISLQASRILCSQLSKSSNKTTAREAAHLGNGYLWSTNHVKTWVAGASCSHANASWIHKECKVWTNSVCKDKRFNPGWNSGAEGLKATLCICDCINDKSSKCNRSVGSSSKTGAATWTLKLSPDLTATCKCSGTSLPSATRLHLLCTQKVAISMAFTTSRKVTNGSTEKAPCMMPSLVGPSRSAVRTTAALCARLPCSRITWHALCCLLNCGGLGRTMWMEKGILASSMSIQARLRSSIQVTGWLFNWTSGATTCDSTVMMDIPSSGNNESFIFPNIQYPMCPKNLM